MQFVMEKENSNPPMDHQSKEEAVIRDAMAPDVVEAVVGGLRTPKFVDGSKQEAAVRDAASTSADTVETGTQNNAMIFWDEVDEDDYWVQQEDLDAPLDVDVAQVVNPWLDFLMATVAPETAALLPSSAPFMPTPTFSTLAPMSTPTTSLLPRQGPEHQRRRGRVLLSSQLSSPVVRRKRTAMSGTSPSPVTLKG